MLLPLLSRKSERTSLRVSGSQSLFVPDPESLKSRDASVPGMKTTLELPFFGSVVAKGVPRKLLLPPGPVWPEKETYLTSLPAIVVGISPAQSLHTAFLFTSSLQTSKCVGLVKRKLQYLVYGNKPVVAEMGKMLPERLVHFSSYLRTRSLNIPPLLNAP